MGAAGLAALFWALSRAGQFLVRRARGLPAGWPQAAVWALTAGLAGFAAANLFEHGLIHDRGVHVALAWGAALVLARRPARLRRPERRRVFSAVWRAEVRRPAAGALARELEARRRERAALYDLLGRGLESKRTPCVLELGCGAALDSLNLVSAGCEVHALDGSEAALQQAAAHAEALGRVLHLRHADVRRTGLPSEKFDLVFSQGLLEHFPDPGPVWAEMARVLKPDGALVVDVPQTWNPYTLAKLWHRWRGDWPWGWETQYTVSRLRAEAGAADLKTVAAQGYGYRGGPLDVTAWLRDRVRPWAPRVWEAWEYHTGAWWMMNVVVLFKKRGS